MARRRGSAQRTDVHWLTGGPGRLCQAFGVTRAAHNGLDVTAANSPVRVFDDGYSGKAIEVSKRIGIRKAADEMLRYVLSSDLT
jgi:DNA-3-methyladenine glycosylase